MQRPIVRHIHIYGDGDGPEKNSALLHQSHVSPGPTIGGVPYIKRLVFSEPSIQCSTQQLLDPWFIYRKVEAAMSGIASYRQLVWRSPVADGVSQSSGLSAQKWLQDFLSQPGDNTPALCQLGHQGTKLADMCPARATTKNRFWTNRCGANSSSEEAGEQ